MTGKRFERAFMYNARKHYGRDVEDCVDTVLDLFSGTDYIINGLRVDITLNYKKKDHTVLIGEAEYGYSSNFKVQYGFRTGNKKATFEMPVLVIGITDVSGYLTKGVDWALQEFGQKLDQIVEEGTDLYWQHVDELEGEE